MKIWLIICARARAKRQLHLLPPPVLRGHRRSPRSCHGNRKQEGKLSRAPNSDTLCRLRQTWLSCTSSAKAGVRSCCLFNFLTSHKRGPSTSLFFTLSLSLSSLISLSLLVLKNIFTHTLVDICSHIFSLSASLHPAVLSHIYIYIYSCYFEQQSAGAALSVCENETEFVVPVLRLLWPKVTITPSLSTLQQRSEPRKITAAVCLSLTHTHMQSFHMGTRTHTNPLTVSGSKARDVCVCMCGDVCVCMCGADGVATVSNTVWFWQQISSEVICYSDRAASIFSRRERTNHEEEQAKWDNKGTKRKETVGGKWERQRSDERNKIWG